MKDILMLVAAAAIALVMLIGFLIMTADCAKTGGRMMREPWGTWECVK